MSGSTPSSTSSSGRRESETSHTESGSESPGRRIKKKEPTRESSTRLSSTSTSKISQAGSPKRQKSQPDYSYLFKSLSPEPVTRPSQLQLWGQSYYMKTAIRLQNHGCTNHPYWWIVVAANRKNIKGRFLEHVGYWAPRQGIHAERQIVLNVPRIKYWISCGAVPTNRVQKFLALWSILPAPWYQQKTQEEFDALKKPESQWTDKDRIKEQRKRKRRQREKLSPVNYHIREAKFKGAQYSQLHKYRNKLREKIYAAERENQILRELLLHNEFQKVNRINELSGNVVYDDSQELARLQVELSKAKTELALLDRTFKNTSILQKIKMMQDINKLVDKIREVQKERQPFRKRNLELTHEDENITKYQLDKKLQYELVSKKIEKMNQDFALIDKLHEVITLEEFANHLQSQQPGINPDIALQAAQQIFIERGKTAASPLTKFDIYFAKEISKDDPDLVSDPIDINEVTFTKRKTVDGKSVQDTTRSEELRRKSSKKEKDEEQKEKEERMENMGKTELERKNYQELKKHDQILKKIDQPRILTYLLARPDVIVPTSRPVHPFPDFTTYIPEEYYDPISTLDLDMVPISSIEPKQELEKYYQKRNYTNPQASTKANSSSNSKKSKAESVV